MAGYTALIHEMDEVLKDLKRGKFMRTQVTANETQGGESRVESKMLDMHQGSSSLVKSDNIKFEDVPIISPNGDVLIEKMNFEI